jgi:hypothetical protein
LVVTIGKLEGAAGGATGHFFIGDAVGPRGREFGRTGPHLHDAFLEFGECSFLKESAVGCVGSSLWREGLIFDLRRLASFDGCLCRDEIVWCDSNGLG